MDMETQNNYPSATCPSCGVEVGHPGQCPECHSHAGMLIGFAIDIANDVHNGQFRKGGIRPPYIVHPIAVLNKMLRWGIAETSLLSASVLHDAVEDGRKPAEIAERINEVCGPVVANYVLEMTCSVEKKAYLESFQSKSVGSLFLKLADRFCNVNDFFHDKSTEKYAAKYFRKADAVFAAFLNREDECIEKYGRETYQAAHYELMQLANLFGQKKEILALTAVDSTTIGRNSTDAGTAIG